MKTYDGPVTSGWLFLIKEAETKAPLLIRVKELGWHTDCEPHVLLERVSGHEVRPYGSSMWLSQFLPLVVRRVEPPQFGM